MVIEIGENLFLALIGLVTIKKLSDIICVVCMKR